MSERISEINEQPRKVSNIVSRRNVFRALGYGAGIGLAALFSGFNGEHNKLITIEQERIKAERIAGLRQNKIVNFNTLRKSSMDLTDEYNISAVKGDLKSIQTKIEYLNTEYGGVYAITVPLYFRKK